MALADQATLRVPENAIAVLTEFAELAVDKTESLLSSLGESATTYGRPVLIAAVRAAFPAWDESSAKDLVSVWLSLHSVKKALALTDNQAVAAAAARSPDLKMEETTRTALADRLTRALSASQVEMTVLGEDLLREHEHSFRGARILTDIRPLFREGSERHIDGAVVVHSLRLNYEDVDRKSLHVAMDNTDLAELLSVVERAIRKQERLEALLKDITIPIVETGGAAIDEEEQ